MSSTRSFVARTMMWAAVACAASGLATTPAAAEALLVIEADSGRVLYAHNAGQPWYPASVTKLMTAYVTLRAVEEGRITLDKPLTVSATAAAQAPVKMGFPPGTVDRLVQAWPDEALAEIGLTRGTAVAMLTHDPKLDDPALKLALPSPAFYVGALGSKTTQAKRRARLLEAGVSEAALDRLYGPIGLDLGASTPEEIALSIMAEIVKARAGRQ